MSRRKTITIQLNPLPAELLFDFLDAIRSKYPEADLGTVKITALAKHSYGSKSFEAFCNRIHDYIVKWGNRRVTKSELAKIGRVSRPTLDTYIRHGLLEPCEYLPARDLFDLNEICKKH